MNDEREQVIIYGLGDMWQRYSSFLEERYHIMFVSDKSGNKHNEYSYIPFDKLTSEPYKIIICIDTLYEQVYADFCNQGIYNFEWIFDILDYDLYGKYDSLRMGMEFPPAYYKHCTIKEYAKRFNCDWLIETGTYRGDTVRAALNSFKGISSIELSHSLYLENKQRFGEISKINLYHGDSADNIRKMISDVDNTSKIIFWLDGHYSGGETAKSIKETPICEELTEIAKMRKIDECCILIDDARCFNGLGDYPNLIELEKTVNNLWKDCFFIVMGDIIRITSSKCDIA